MATFPVFAAIELPNPYEVILRSAGGKTVELPWDFVRYYCDVSYRPRMEAVAARGRQSIGSRIRRLQRDARLSQKDLAIVAGISRVTLARIENGEQSPRFETLVALARGLGRPVSELLSDEAAGKERLIAS